MTNKMQTFAWLSLFLFPFGSVWTANNENHTAKQFTEATIRFEQNVTDQDVEVVIEAKGGVEGLVKLSVVAPNGNNIVNVAVPDTNSLGLRHFNFESPEPKDIKGLKAAYPEGEYTFSGITSSGGKLNAKATLNHVLAEPASVLRPKADAEQVSVKDLEIAWSPVKNAAAYIVSIEQVDSDINFTAKLPGSATRLLVPNGFLVSGREYNLGIGTVTAKGNITYAETSFTTESTKK